MLKALCGAAALLAVSLGGALSLGHGDGPVRVGRGAGERLGDRAPRYRYIYNSSPAQTAAAARGWNQLDVGSKWAADRLPSGTRGLVWVGDYDNSACRWEVPDAELGGDVSTMAGDRKVAGFFFSDEPDPFECPDSPGQHRARSRFIHSLAPRKITVMVMDANSGRDSLRQLPWWVGAADYVGLDPYPCHHDRPCRYSWIDRIIRAADAAGLSYWGVVQAFADDDSWRWPTPHEEARMLSQWAASRQKGSMTFAWEWAGRALMRRPRLLRVLQRFNRKGMRIPKAEAAGRGAAAEVHYTFIGPRSVAFQWRGAARTIRYGRSPRAMMTVRARAPRPLPFSSRGPFRSARLTGLKPGTSYHYAIGDGPRFTFKTVPRTHFRFDVEADVGSADEFDEVGATQRQIAADRPSFVLVAGDLTYGNDDGQAAVGRHFDDVMAWSRRAAYMPAWGNHEWDDASDDLRNYKGRFVIPHGAASPDAPAKGCCGEDWGWFDAGGVRFISYPEPYGDATWPAWRAKAGRLMAAAEARPGIRFIVTFGHRPAYSTGYHHGEEDLAAILDGLGERFSKYVLNLNGHSHDYERFRPIHGVTHITAGGGGAPLEPPWNGRDDRTVHRAMHLAHLRVHVSSSALHVEAICGPASSHDDVSCRPGQVIDSYRIGLPQATRAR